MNFRYLLLDIRNNFVDPSFNTWYEISAGYGRSRRVTGYGRKYTKMLNKFTKETGLEVEVKLGYITYALLRSDEDHFKLSAFLLEWS